MESELLTPAELAAKLHKTAPALAQWRYRGMGPKFVKLGSGVRYRASDVEAWLDAQTRSQTGQVIPSV
ncbi:MULTISPECIES: AlpA family transcriptional regulator [unclassified Arthrobacter]|jgi:predicted DNA-binding transcriptional regulator AlpA|uniref:helix-turn-helix transcriptional regulator n=1 Tax=unclassified Arthrobacter TaxID=235627 RepID=UPI000484830E|nr:MULTISPECIES: helix-turn-helix domain-containing protein [unclassified Arthrobacter]MBB6406175.1 putative DNA-binding transcriptional regulator AlpA [Arthrobacter sp. AZCC_0090]